MLEIQVDKLRALMDLMKPAIPKKSTLKVTAYISLGNGKAVATDLESMIIADLPEAEEPMLLPFASLAEMLKYVPGNADIKVEALKKQISLSWDGGTASYPTEAVQDFPVLPELPARAESSIDGDALVAALLAALPYVKADDSTRPVLSGITLILGNPVEVAAGDGFRMSHQVLGLSFPLEEKVILPAHAVDILGHVFAKTPRTPPTDADSLIPIITAKRQLHISLLGKNKVRVDFGQTASVVINLIEGSPPDWLQLIPQGEPVLQSQLFALQLEAAVKRVRAIARDGSGIVRMVFADGKLTVSAKGDDQQVAAVMDTLHTQGEPGRTALNYSYLLDYLSGKQGIVIFSKYTDTGPVVFEYQKSPRVLIMPMQVDWGDEKPPAPETTEPAPETTQEKPETEATIEETAEEDLEERVDERDRALDAEQEAIKAEEEAAGEEKEPEPVAATKIKTRPKRTRKR